MRLLGPSGSLPSFRWDLIYLAAQLSTDERPGIADLASPIQSALDQLDAERAAFEDDEDQAVIATALLHKRDRKRDRVVVELGGVARATAREVYAGLFPKHNPSQTAKLGFDAESMEIVRILGELGSLHADHPLRGAYEKDLQGAQVQLEQAKAKADQADTALALRRTHIERFKLKLDQLRLETHGKLLVLLKDKAEAESFFRPTTAAPSEEKPAEKPTEGT
ncbi:hypothetical protein [Polyangium aurulentum]|uniref:hypothetical protein n=1 Tax=Polyangium aurulentum TaxID=2567896 RepID=UPI0010AEE232|nr:hypothetical protein [Polyangium aurulentum]UQA55740.1 hypothetical protein E8A73_030955 [Polyangium aurulentum]